MVILYTYFGMGFGGSAAYGEAMTVNRWDVTSLNSHMRYFLSKSSKHIYTSRDVLLITKLWRLPDPK